MISMRVGSPPVLGYSEIDEFVSVSETYNPESEYYINKELIYIGEFSRVVKCHLKGEPAKRCAIKTVQKYRNGKETDYRAETEALRKVKGDPFVQQFVHSYSTNIFHYVVSEFVPGGDLLSLIDRYPDGLGEDCAKFYLAELCLAIKALHDRDVIHGDISPENILLDETGHVVLCDLDSQQREVSRLQGSDQLVWQPPEILYGFSRFSKAADWRAFGIIAFYLAYGHLPHPKHLNHSSPEPDVIRDENGLRVYCNSPQKSAFASLLTELLDPHPDMRLGNRGASGIMKHEYFQDTNWSEVQSKELIPPYVPREETLEEEQTKEMTECEDEIVTLLRKMSRGFCISKIC